MKRTFKVLILALVVIMLFGTVFSSASEPYDTYTYSIDGEPLKSPAAYSAMDDFTALDMNLGAFGAPNFSSASDIFSDNEANIYIADKGNNRVVVLNKFYETIAVLSEYVDENGKRVESKRSIVMKDTRNVDGLTIDIDEENATVSYRVVFYGVDGEYLSTTESMTTDYEKKDTPDDAETFRVVVTPNKVDGEDVEIGVLDVGKYASQLAVTYKK